MTCSCREALEKIILPPDGQTRSLDSNYYRIQIIAREALAKPCECEEHDVVVDEDARRLVDDMRWLEPRVQLPILAAGADALDAALTGLEKARADAHLRDLRALDRFLAYADEYPDLPPRPRRPIRDNPQGGGGPSEPPSKRGAE
jgi:hypothetical protein